MHTRPDWLVIIPAEGTSCAVYGGELKIITNILLQVSYKWMCDSNNKKQRKKEKRVKHTSFGMHTLA